MQSIQIIILLIHMENAVKLAMFGKVNIAAQLDEGYGLGIRQLNEEVDKNWLIDFIDRIGELQSIACTVQSRHSTNNAQLSTKLLIVGDPLSLTLVSNRAHQTGTSYLK